MRTEIPKMSHEERQARAQAKREVLLRFLANECYTSVAIAAQLMAVSSSTAERTLVALVREGAVKFESHIVAAHKTHIYGITSHGLAKMDQFDRPYFQLGRTNSSYYTHHLETQRARIGEQAGGI
jgi:predicted ArsR family transcriptional regulator